MTPLEAVEQTAAPILEYARGWLMAPETFARAGELGLEGPFSFWVNGRAGVLGDVDADVAAAAIGFMYGPTVRAYWEGRPAGLAPRDVAQAYGECAALWGRQVLADFAEGDLAELDGLGRRIIDAADPSVGTLFAGWRALAPPADPAGAVTVTLHVCRELRGGAHLSAVHAAGLGPVGAIMSVADPVRGGAAGAERFGWPSPHPEGDVEKRVEAERCTSLICLPAYSALSESELDRFVELTHSVRSAYND